MAQKRKQGDDEALVDPPPDENGDRDTSQKIQIYGSAENAWITRFGQTRVLFSFFKIDSKEKTTATLFGNLCSEITSPFIEFDLIVTQIGDSDLMKVDKILAFSYKFVDITMNNIRGCAFKSQYYGDSSVPLDEKKKKFDFDFSALKAACRTLSSPITDPNDFRVIQNRKANFVVKNLAQPSDFFILLFRLGPDITHHIGVSEYPIVKNKDPAHVDTINEIYRRVCFLVQTTEDQASSFVVEGFNEQRIRSLHGASSLIHRLNIERDLYGNTAIFEKRDDPWNPDALSLITQECFGDYRIVDLEKTKALMTKNEFVYTMAISNVLIKRKVSLITHDFSSTPDCYTKNCDYFAAFQGVINEEKSKGYNVTVVAALDCRVDTLKTLTKDKSVCGMREIKTELLSRDMTKDVRSRSIIIHGAHTLDLRDMAHLACCIDKTLATVQTLHLFGNSRCFPAISGHAFRDMCKWTRSFQSPPRFYGFSRDRVHMFDFSPEVFEQIKQIMTLEIAKDYNSNQVCIVASPSSKKKLLSDFKDKIWPIKTPKELTYSEPSYKYFIVLLDNGINAAELAKCATLSLGQTDQVTIIIGNEHELETVYKRPAIERKGILLRTLNRGRVFQSEQHKRQKTGWLVS